MENLAIEPGWRTTMWRSVIGCGELATESRENAVIAVEGGAAGQCGERGWAAGGSSAGLCGERGWAAGGSSVGQCGERGRVADSGTMGRCGVGHIS
jgi:hypothetical protein